MQSTAATRNLFDSSARCLGCMEEKTQPGACPRCGWTDNQDAGSVLHLPPGTILNGVYAVGRVLGQGGFGITYLGWDTTLSQKIAIKEYFPQSLASRQRGNSTVVPTSDRAAQDFQYGMTSFLAEGKILARFSEHPCIVPVLTLFEANGTAYLVMRYIEGITLAQYLTSKGGKIPYQQAIELMDRVMDGLREVHSQNLLHRDISPDNIYVTKQSTVKILDFGAARFSVGERSQSLSVVLKPGYAPEEQYRRNGKQGPWTDVYATAATLYRCITGTVPPEALDRMAEDTLKMPSQLGVRVPPAVEAVLRTALAVRSDDRFATMQAFQAEMNRAAGRCETSQPPEKPENSEKTAVSHNIRNLIGAALILVVLVVAGIFVSGWLEDQKMAQSEPLPQFNNGPTVADSNPQPAFVPVDTANDETLRKAEDHLRRTEAALSATGYERVGSQTSKMPAKWQCNRDNLKYKIRKVGDRLYIAPDAAPSSDAFRLEVEIAANTGQVAPAKGHWYGDSAPGIGYAEVMSISENAISGFVLKPTVNGARCITPERLKDGTDVPPRGCLKVPVVWRMVP